MALMVVACLVIGLSDGWLTVAAGMALLGLCTAPLNTVRSIAAEDDVPAHRKAEAFGTLFAANGVGFALGGLLLALLPIDWMLMSGGASAAVAVALLPVLGSRN